MCRCLCAVDSRRRLQASCETIDFHVDATDLVSGMDAVGKYQIQFNVSSMPYFKVLLLCDIGSASMRL